MSVEENRDITGELSALDRVYTALRGNILDLTFLPGRSISANEISALMKVSRTPVQGAFIRLSREGLVQVLPQKGTIISRIDLDRAHQERFLRESLELAALDLFLPRCKADDIGQLSALIELQQEKVAQKDFAGLIDYDDAFHRLIFEIAGQPLCWEAVESMSGHYRRCRLMTIWNTSLTSDVISQHRALVDGVASGDLEGTRKKMEHHLRKLSVEEGLLLSSYPNFFEKNPRQT